MTSQFKITNNTHMKTKKKSKNKKIKDEKKTNGKSQIDAKIVKLSWFDIEKMSDNDFDNYLTCSFKILK